MIVCPVCKEWDMYPDPGVLRDPEDRKVRAGNVWMCLCSRLVCTSNPGDTYPMFDFAFDPYRDDPVTLRLEDGQLFQYSFADRCESLVPDCQRQGLVDSFLALSGVAEVLDT